MSCAKKCFFYNFGHGN